jgi:two-component system CheB/CheR fusion protein
MDGVVGLEAIKTAGGITFAQDENDHHTGMPMAAIFAGCVDAVLSPSAMASEIARFSRHPYVMRFPDFESNAETIQSHLDTILDRIREATGVAFSNYERTNLYRAITRREVLHRLNGLKEYARFLESNPAEVRALYQDMLGGGTSFFRNPGAFRALKATILPRLVKGRSRHDPVRVWVIGCSTGAEAYSIATAYAELMETTRQQIPLQMFATDLNQEAIEKARGGSYSEPAVSQVSVERLGRFFFESEGTYHIAKLIRETIVFAPHNLLSDPPFSRIDLVSCQNLLIYLTPVAQQRAMTAIHWSLNPSGILWLGGSEGIGPHRNLFEGLDSRHKFYVKRPEAIRYSDMASLWGLSMDKIDDPVRPHGGLRLDSLQRETNRVLVARYAPAGVLVNGSWNILLFWGDTGTYLRPPTDEPTLSLLPMLREDMLVRVRGAPMKAARDGVSVREPRLQVETSGGYRHLDVQVIPLKGHDNTDVHFLVLFEQPASSLADSRAVGQFRKLTSKADVRSQRQELVALREYAQFVIEQQQDVNVALQSSQSELDSVNQELQSINEELEMSRVETFSSNEELVTARADLQALHARYLALCAYFLEGGSGADPRASGWAPIALVARSDQGRATGLRGRGH